MIRTEVYEDEGLRSGKGVNLVVTLRLEGLWKGWVGHDEGSGIREVRMNLGEETVS